ncbi:hypothetical protein [Paraglaciecola sp.]|uniref:hypothetical protein n=1 Tax=Paraglaciecola sp. TaxID=1920173 RepID=UPI003EF40189
MLKNVWFLLLLGALTGCANYDYSSQVKIGEPMIKVQGESLEGQSKSLPDDLLGQNTLLLLGYKQDSQFDIDRWLIALDMTQTNISAYEIPTIQGMFPRMFSTYIDNGMRRGIPKELWKGVITVYADGDRVQRFTGNQNPNNARVILLDSKGKIMYFYDRGFAVSALNEIRTLLGQ